MARHLDMDERIFIQRGLQEKKDIKAIAQEMGRDRSTIYREIQKNIKIIEAKGNICANMMACNISLKCESDTCMRRGAHCAVCRECNGNCSAYEPRGCSRRDSFPYICNGCSKIANCNLEKRRYETRYADEQVRRRMSESRRGIALSDEEFVQLDELMVERAKKGHAFAEICRNNADRMPVSERTVYRYMERELFSMDRITLRRTVQRRNRRKSGPVKKTDRKCHIGRTYEDFQAFMEENPDLTVSELDSVEGPKGSKAVLLTVFIETCSVQIYILRERNTSATVSYAFDYLRDVLGEERFRKIFQVLLCDRGSEFTDPMRMENDHRTGQQWCRVFFCDPMNSNQKSRCERNHQLLRYVIEKGKSMKNLTQEDVNLVMNHVNSYPRKTLGWKAPIDLFIELYGQETATLLGLEKIEPNEINLTPSLLQK